MTSTRTQLLIHLRSGTSAERARAAWELSSDYDASVAQGLIDAFVAEGDPQVWAVILESLFPLRLIDLDLHLAGLHPWPLNPTRTFAFCKRLGGYRSQAVEQHYVAWANLPDPLMRLSSALYRAQSGSNMPSLSEVELLSSQAESIVAQACERIPGANEVTDLGALRMLFAVLRNRVDSSPRPRAQTWTGERIDRMIHREGRRLPKIAESVCQLYDTGLCDFDETAGQWFRENRSFEDWDFNPNLLAFWEPEILPTILLRSTSLTFRVLALETIGMGSSMWDDASILVYYFSDIWKLDLLSVEDLRICTCRQLVVMRIAFRHLAALEPPSLWPDPMVWARGFELVSMAARRP